MANNTLLESTIESARLYSNLEKTILAKELIEKGVIVSTDDVKKKVHLKSLDISNIIQQTIRTRTECIKDIEKWEFEKAYKYSIFYDIKSVDIGIIKKMILSGKIFDFENDPDKYENQHLRITESSIPSLRIMDGKYVLKFNVRLRRFEINNKEISVRYPICVIIDIENNFMEVRCDGYPGLYDGDKFQHIEDIVAWLKTNAYIYVSTIDMYPTMKAIITDIDSIMDKYKGKVHITWQDMRLKKGGKATVGCNKDGNLPFVDELKNFLNENMDLFNKVLELKSKYERFIKQTIKLADYPAVKIIFDELKGMEAKIVFNYEKKNFSLIQHYVDDTQDSCKKERMEYVSDFIFENRKNHIEKTLEQKSVSCV